jgi:dipeptidyl aminopeptidase/acylaminoacyl peptidase
MVKFQRIIGFVVSLAILHGSECSHGQDGRLIESSAVQWKDEALASRSPVLWADEISKSTPLLILHGASDSKVDPQGAVVMAASLLKSQHPFRLVLFEKAEHSLREHEDEVNRLTRLWLTEYLDTKNPPK